MSLKEDYAKAQALTLAAKAELAQAEADYDAKWDCLNRKVIDAERMEANLKDRLIWECLRSKLNAAARGRKRCKE